MKRDNEKVLVLESNAPINDGGKKLDMIYPVLAVCMLIVFISLESNILGMIFAVVLGVAVGWLIKNRICEVLIISIKNTKFLVNNKIPYPELVERLKPILTPLGYVVDLSGAPFHRPLLSYEGESYSILYSNDNTFQILWEKKLVKRLFMVNYISTYQKEVEAMGMIGYHVQQVCDHDVSCQTSETVSFEAKSKDENEKIFEDKQEEIKIPGNMENNKEMSSEVSGNGKNKNIFQKIWDSVFFTKIAIKFETVSEIIAAIVCIILGQVFSEDGSTVLSCFFYVVGIGSVFFTLKGFFSKKKKRELDAGTIGKNKRNICIAAVVLIVGLVIWNKTGGGDIPVVQSMVFDNYGKKSIGEIVEREIKNPQWSKEELDSISSLIYVKGYCPRFSENIQICFYCEEDGDYLSAELNQINFLDSGERYTDPLEISSIWSLFYE